MDEPVKKKKYSPEQALQKAMSYCAYQERCHQELRDKLYEWGLWPDAVENIISRLISENFLNEERFAKSYSGGKFRIKGWGKVKIKLALKHKKISDYCIRKGLQEISDDEYEKSIRKLISASLKKITDKNPLKKKYKVANYLISRGYEPDLVWAHLGEDQ